MTNMFSVYLNFYVSKYLRIRRAAECELIAIKCMR